MRRSMRWTVAVLPTMLLVGCQRLGGREAATPPALAAAATVATVATATADPAQGMVTDANFLCVGRAVYARDLLFRLDRLRRYSDTMREGAERERYRRTIDALVNARQTWPQATRFQVEADGAGLRLSPLDWQAEVAVTREMQPRVVVVGGELESVITAVAAADRGWQVVLLYAGPLGGLCSDSGGNLRYFDGEPFLPRPEAQLRVFHDGLGMSNGNYWALPADVSARLERFVRGWYGSRIHLLPTATYNSLHVTTENNKVTGLVTGEGVRVVATNYIDTDPEARLSEKAGLTPSVVTPNLSYGLVFDVTGLTNADWARLPRRITPEYICSLASTRPTEFASGTNGAKSVRRLLDLAATDRPHVFSNTRFGYSVLAEGFNLYMQCRGLRDQDKGLRWLNEARCTSGFNVSVSGDRATFNSVSYHFAASILQEDHDLTKDAQLAPLMTIERPALEGYLRALFGTRRLKVVFPPQFYVRKASALFAMAHPYGQPDFLASTPHGRLPGGGLWMSYGMDLRDLRPRDNWERDTMASFEGLSGGRRTWRCRGSAAQTMYGNLFLVSKSGMPAQYYGGMRILQNLINTGSSLIDDLAKAR